MNPITCKLAFRQILDATVASAFEKAILALLNEEFTIKSQAYNPEQRFSTFKQMVANDPKANALHYKLGSVVAHLIDQLQQTNPYLQDNLGNALPFETCQFKLINAHLTDRSLTQVALFFLSTPYELVQSLGDYVLLREVTPHSPYAEDYQTTTLVGLQPNLSFFDASFSTHPERLSANAA